MSVSTALEARDVSVVIDEQVMLAPTSLAVAAGEAIALRGRNGAGKTTMLRVLSGRLPASSGTVLLGGTPVSSRSAREAIAALIGAPAIAPELTLREQVRYVRATWGANDEEGRESADSLLTEFGIPDLRDRYPHELSSGQTQLFHLALGFSRPGSVRLLDEPEQRLDATRRALVAAALRARLAQGAAVVFATHSDELVAAVGARTLVIDTGDDIDTGADTGADAGPV